jgi:hypothetical protein
MTGAGINFVAIEYHNIEYKKKERDRPESGLLFIIHQVEILPQLQQVVPHQSIHP